MSEPARLYPSSRPQGHFPPIQRYSSRFEAETGQLVVLFVGAQVKDDRAAAAFSSWLSQARTLQDGPAHLDRATFRDGAGIRNDIAALYWDSRPSFDRWAGCPTVLTWRMGDHALGDTLGFWWEPVSVAPARAETIAFKEYLRGLSACPFSRIEPMEETGYWGAARDRIPSSAYDLLESSMDELSPLPALPVSRGRRLAVSPPRGLTVIRSGVSWDACEGEQLDSFERNVRPKLDRGMDHLREHPVETGCFSLRQVVLTDDDGHARNEGYSLGLFVSLGHLERWAKYHPTHLAIYHRALAERKRFQDQLQLRTYNEIYVLGDNAYQFEYTNCHEQSGLLPYISAQPA